MFGLQAEVEHALSDMQQTSRAQVRCPQLSTECRKRREGHNPKDDGSKRGTEEPPRAEDVEGNWQDDVTSHGATIWYIYKKLS
jgi:hypothetical protein